MKPNSSAITSAEALFDGYKALTTPYSIPDEQVALNRTMKDMERGKIDYILVGTQDSLAVWRKNMKEERNNNHEPSAGTVGVCTKRKSVWGAYEPKTL